MPIIEIDDVKIHFTQTGSGPAIVFIAGSSLGTFVWDQVIETVGTSYQSIAIDLRGSGKSDAPRGQYTILEMSQEVRGVLARLSVNEAIIVGHSMGGFVAQQLALSHSSLVKGLILVSTASSGNPKHLKTSPDAKKALMRTTGSFEEIFRGMMDVGLGHRIKEEHPEIIEHLVTSQLKNPPRGFGFAGQRAAIARFDSRHNLAQIKCPCLVVHGPEDQVIPKECGLALNKEIAGSKFTEIAGVGHFPPVEASAELAEAIAGLLNVP